MSRKRSRLSSTFAIVITMFAVVCVSFQFRNSAALTKLESSFVGTWENELPADAITFYSDRTFSDGEFEGNWWISYGNLNLKMWRADPTVFANRYANLVAVPFVNGWESVMGETVSFQLRLQPDSAEIQYPGSNEPDTWVRVQ